MTNEKIKADARAAEQDGRYYAVAAEFDYAIRAAGEVTKQRITVYCPECCKIHDFLI